MRNNSTKKSLKASVLSLMLCIAMLIGTTFAWFTDSITNTGNKIEAGNLDIAVEKWDKAQNNYVDIGKKALFNYNKWEPGYTAIQALKVVNNGTLALKYQVDFIAATEGNDNGKLAQSIDVYYKENANAAEGMANALTGFTKAGTLADFLNKKDGAWTGTLNANGNADYTMIALHMPESVGNDVQKLNSGYFDIVIRATQNTHETDGFGSDQYDKDAKLPWDGYSKEEITPNTDGNYDIASPANLAWLADELTKGNTDFKGKSITLENDIDMNNKDWNPIVLGANDTGITFEGNGKTIKNLKVDDVAKGENGVTDGYGGGFIRQATGKVTIKDLKFDNVTVAPGKNYSFNKVCNVVGIVMGYSYGETLFENVHVTNSTVEGFGKVGVMLGMGADPGIKVTFKDCVSKNNTIKAGYNAGGLAGNIQRKNGVDNTVISNCTVEGNTFKPYYGENKYIDLSNQTVAFTENDLSNGTPAPKTIGGKHWIEGGAYWGAYAKYYVSYGSSSYDAPITTEGAHKGVPIANSEICINNISDIPKK